MFRLPPRRAAHYLLLTAAWAVACLPGLGAVSLWDVDEGNNAEAAREMLQSGNWVVPTFNYRLREDKPALLYWLQGACYRLFGVNEWAARLPSALAALLAVLATYELGRQTFGKRAGLLAGLVLVGSPAFLGAAHFANPDALLTACTTVTLLLFWHDYRRNGTGWLSLVGASMGLGMLAKGPVGLVLPIAVCQLFLLWRREWRRSLDRRVVWVVLLFAVVAAPWYIWVSVETKGEWLFGFFRKHHAERVATALEGHSGPPYYYLLVLVAGLGPWAVFLGPTVWHAWRRLRDGSGGPKKEGPGEAAPSSLDRPAVQFLLCWVAVYLVSFSLVRTKLPNYVLPAYPPLALLCAGFLDRWRRGLVAVRPAVVRVSLASLALLGVGVSAALLAASGAVGGLADRALRGHSFPGLLPWAALGAVPLAAALLGWAWLRLERRGALVATLAGAAVLFTALGALAVRTFEPYKAPRGLAAALPADQLDHEVRLASFAWFRPSLVFYCRREVVELPSEEQALVFLDQPLPAYLFVPARDWERLSALAPQARVLARRYDLYGGKEVLLVTNVSEPDGPVALSGPPAPQVNAGR